MYRSPADRKAEAARLQQLSEVAAKRSARAEINEEPRTSHEYKIGGHYSNDRIVKRNGGVPHQFLNSIGGDSANYR